MFVENFEPLKTSVNIVFNQPGKDDMTSCILLEVTVQHLNKLVDVETFTLPNQCTIFTLPKIS